MDRSDCRYHSSAISLRIDPTINGILKSFSELTVVVPTRNNHPEIVAHLGSQEAIVSLGAEIVFVDSESSDGTLKALAAFRKNHGGKVLDLPPGLYAAWNAGVQVATRTWITFGTIGDTQSIQELQHLLDIAESTQSDIVVSPPEMRIGKIASENRWPIHRLAAKLDSVQSLNRNECLQWLCGFLPGTMLGSAASNIYKRSLLQAKPFPTKFGHEGDVAWGIEIASSVRIAVTPQQCSDFQIHARETALDARLQRQRFLQLIDLARESLLEFPEVVAEFEISWDRQMELWDWICRLEGVADVSREQKAYINQLERERSELRDIVIRLEKLPVLPLAPFLKRGLLSPILRRMRSRPPESI
jgi:hypothetical protein